MAFTDGYIDGDRSLAQMMDESYQSSYTQNSTLWTEGQIDKRFKVGDQNLLSLMYGDSAFYSQRKFFFNLIRRNVDMVGGYQRQHRKTSNFVPINQDDQNIADDYTALSMWSERREGFHEAFSEAFEDALDVGISYLYLYNDYSRDPVSGDLVCDNVAYNNVLIDPYFRKPDLSDCNYVWRRSWVSKQRAKQFLPGKAEEIDGMNPDGLKDGKFPIQAESLDGNVKNLFTYDEYHYLSDREAILIVDTKTGEVTEWEENPDDDKNEMEMVLAQQPWLAIKKVRKPTVKLAIILGGKEMYHGENLLGIDSYPIVPVTCYHDPDVTNCAYRIQGMVRGMRDAQYLYNRRRVIELAILESQVTSGYKYKVGSVTDESAFRQTGQGMLIPVNTNAEMSDVEQITAPGIPSSMMELSRSLADDITKISGVSEELLGMADDDKSGILSMLRQGANLTTLQTIFDKADNAQKLFAQIRIASIRKNWSTGKIEQILGRKPEKDIRLTNTQRFDVAVEQGMYSSTQKQTQLRQTLYLMEMGVKFPPEYVIEIADMQNKTMLLEFQEKQKQAAQEQQEQAAQKAQQDEEMQRMINVAKMESDIALAKEREASAIEKIARIEGIHASAEHKESEADLNIVKQLIELEDMNLRQLKESLTLAEIIKQQTPGGDYV